MAESDPSNFFETLSAQIDKEDIERNIPILVSGSIALFILTILSIFYHCHKNCRKTLHQVGDFEVWHENMRQMDASSIGQTMSVMTVQTNKTSVFNNQRKSETGGNWLKSITNKWKNFSFISSISGEVNLGLDNDSEWTHAQPTPPTKAPRTKSFKSENSRPRAPSQANTRRKSIMTQNSNPSMLVEMGVKIPGYPVDEIS